MKRLALLIAASILVAGCGGSRGRGAEVVVGAVYPTSGSQGRGGTDEYRGVQLAAEYANARGGVRGARIALRLEPAANPDQAPGAVRALADAGVPVVLGSHGSTIARPAASTAAREGMMFWETGAIGSLMNGQSPVRSPLVFRFSATGATLGQNAVAFAGEQLLPRLRRTPSGLRYAVAYVDDAYGQSVGLAARDEIRARKLKLAGVFPYSLVQFDAAAFVRKVAAARPDVLFVAAYLDDGVDVRRQLVRQRVPLVASVGTSSSYCMHEFGVKLGKNAVGLFASDKPDGNVIDASRLAPEAADALRWARTQWQKRYKGSMHAGALTGFAGALALFRDVLPRARALTPEAIAAAASTTDIPMGGSPNGGGLAFGRGSGDNVRATSVIWEWVKPRERQVVWPPSFATHPIVAMEL